jgi:FkbM family methyltransferase
MSAPDTPSAKMKQSSTALYRLYFAPKAVLERIMALWPSTRRPIERCKVWIRTTLLPKGPVWVRVKGGLSAQLAMRLRFPEEAGMWLGEHEPEVQSAISSAVQPGWVVFDVGSYIGTVALGAARLVGSTGRVFAFDGDPVNVERLREHAIANQFQGILEVVHAAVWSSGADKTITFRCGKTMRSQGGVETGESRPILGTGDLIDVPVVSLDEFVAAGTPAPDLIKIDVEGGETEVLRGGTKLFATKRPLIIAEIHTTQARDEIRLWLKDNAYSASETALGDPVPVRLLAWPREDDPGPWPHAVSVN